MTGAHIRVGLCSSEPCHSRPVLHTQTGSMLRDAGSYHEVRGLLLGQVCLLTALITTNCEAVAEYVWLHLGQLGAGLHDNQCVVVFLCWSFSPAHDTAYPSPLFPSLHAAL